MQLCVKLATEGRGTHLIERLVALGRLLETLPGEVEAPRELREVQFEGTGQRPHTRLTGTGARPGVLQGSHALAEVVLGKKREF